jgi:hypothetical protein
MKKISLGLCLALGLALGLGSAGCDDEDEPMRSDAGADARTDAAAMCMGTFSSLTRTQLGAMSRAGGKCVAPADLDVICTKDVSTAARMCGTTCYGSNLGATEAALATCSNACVKAQIMPAPSDDCLTCYARALGCTIEKCLTQCLTNPASEPCIDCQTEAKCLEAFYGCTGLPPPPGSGSDAARPDAATDASATDTASTTDTSSGGGTDAASGTDAATGADATTGADASDAAGSADAGAVD